VIKNLQVIDKTNYKIDKIILHKLVRKLKSVLNFELSSLLINFLPDIEIREINSKYLKHNYTTDIITFNYSDDKKLIDAELFISPEVARQNSKLFNVTFKEEILRLVIHGILHLSGYDDKKKPDKLKMKKVEDKFVNETKYLIGR
jgi:rRNA maturation RNase YbeY